MFRAFRVQDKIRYGTFKVLAETFINKDGSVRELVMDAIVVPNQDKDNASSNLISSSSSKSRREGNTRSESQYRSRQTRAAKRALILDEVDVFFEPETLGGTYIPTVPFYHETFPALLDYMWSLKETFHAKEDAGVENFCDTES